MFNDCLVSLFGKLEIRLERITYSTSSSEVVVSVADKGGNRFVGRAQRNCDPFRSIEEALHSALDQFDPTWRSILEN
jgi:hypothetical protein